VDNFVTVDDHTWLTFSNVMVISGNANTNIINIKSLTNNYSYYTQSTDPNYVPILSDVLRVGDSILVSNNIPTIVIDIDYANNIAHLESTLANTVNYANTTVSRTYISSNVQIFNPVIPQYIPEITNESGIPITTSNGQLILLG